MANQEEPQREKKKRGSEGDCNCCRCDEYLKAAEGNLNLAKWHKAEFENYKKRNLDAIRNAHDDGRMASAKAILPLTDALIEARNTMRDPADVEGLEILIRKFDDIIGGLGLEEIPAGIGTPFDPNLHNAVAVEESSGKAPDTIVQIWQKGYTLNNRVIRPTMVKVTK